jgi:Ca2+-dependent lipid-binding protein
MWKPVALRGALGGGGGYVNPIGVMRFHFINGRGLKNLDTVGKSDPYARVLLSGIQKGRTVTWKNNLNPDFDEIFYIPVHSTREKLVVEVMDEEHTQPDRTMGQFEIAAAEYVKMGDDGQYMNHDSKDHVISAQLRIGTSPPKGILNFTVSFYRAIPVVDPEEEEREQEKVRSSADASRPSVESGIPKTPTSPTVPNGHKSLSDGPKHARTDTAGTISSVTSATSADGALRKALADGEKEQEKHGADEAVVPKLHITHDNLTQWECGLLVFKIMHGELAQTNVILEVLVDDNVYPAYASAKAKSQRYNFDEIGDVMIRELDLSRLTVRLVSKTGKGNDDDDQVKAKLTGPTLDTLKRGLYSSTELTLRDSQGRESKITVSFRWIPIDMHLDPSESFNNSGNLRVDVLDAADLPSADRNGFSDPYCKFNLNGQEVFKSKVQKKTLHPAWNEFFEVPVRSRTAAKFEVVVWDWDMADKPDLLGTSPIDLKPLEPFQQKEIRLPLDGKSGTIRLRLLFKPDYVLRSRQGSSTFSGTFAQPGKVMGAPVKGVGKGAAFVGGGVAKGARYVSHLKHKMGGRGS